MYDGYDKLTKAEQKKLMKEIDRLYKESTAEIKAEIDKILDDKAKSQRDKITALGVVLLALWVATSEKILFASESIMGTTWMWYEYASIKLGNPLIMPNDEIAKLIGRTVKKRKDLIHWNRLIRANGRKLDRQVARIVKDGIKNSKTNRQIQAELEKRMKMNRGKAKAIARTETNYYKSEAKLQVGRKQEKHGNTIIKTWVYTHLSNEPREAHKRADNDFVVGIDSYFTIGGFQTKAPQHFGLASQDINCTCDMKMEYEKDVDMSGFEEYKK